MKQTQIFVNGRFRSYKITGLQRYAHELTNRLSLPVFEPVTQLSRGWRGHAWEQTVLPFRSLRGLLWSPCGAGPLMTSSHVVTIHDLFTLDSPHWFHPAFARGYRLLLTALSKTATHLISVSEFTKNRLIRRLGVHPSRITVIHNGVDFEKFYHSPQEAARARNELRLPAGRYLLCLGSLEPRKNLRSLLKAWSAVLSSLPPDISLVVAGSSDAAVFNSPELTRIPDRVAFTGYVPDDLLAGLYSGALAFVYPSLGEGFGLPPLEAMACGVPVLTSNVTSLPEVCGEAAIYADPHDISALAAALKSLCCDSSLRERLAAQGRSRVPRFTWERSASATEILLNRLARAKR